MGSWASKEFVSMDEDHSLTPAMTRKVLEHQFDPRSPSSEIARTPIQLEKTIQAECEALPGQTALDPRSPTIGITRTPVDCQKNGFSGDFGTPYGPPVVRGRTETTATDDSVFTTPKTANTMENLSDVFEDKEMKSSISDQVVKEREPCRQIHQDPKMKLRKKLLSSRSAQVYQDPVGEYQTGQEKNASLPVIRSPLRSLSNGSAPSVASPLQLDSPKMIVQRKQASKLGKIKQQLGSAVGNGNRSPMKYELMKDEQENK